MSAPVVRGVVVLGSGVAVTSRLVLDLVVMAMDCCSGGALR